MLRRGYVETQIEALAKALGTILLRRNEGDYNAAITEIRLAGQKMTGFDPVVLAAMANEALVELFYFNKVFDGAKCYMAGRLLEEQAESHAGLGREDLAFNSCRKAYVLQMEALIHEAWLRTAENVRRIEALESRLDEDLNSFSEQRRRFQFFEAIGNYSRAEDALFEFRIEGDPAWRETAEDFFNRLLALPDEALNRGGLPREEVLAGLEEINNG
jgi:hypothetical protein